MALDIEVNMDGDDVGPRAVEKAQTRNISPGDLYYESSLADRLHVGDVIDIRIDLPVNATNIFGQRSLTVRGRVTRLGPANPGEPNRRGIAVRFLRPPTFRASVD